MAFCENCGAPLNEGETFCGNCGYEVKKAASTVDGQQAQQNFGQQGQQNYQQQYQGQGQQNYQQYNTAGNTGGIQGKSIALCIILSIVTCGIYGIIWMVNANDNINYLSGEPNATSGGMVVLFSIITCGIYGWYWYYKMGQRCNRIEGLNSSNEVLFLVLGIFGLGIINMALMQDKINKAVGFN